MNIVILNECFLTEEQINELSTQNKVTSFHITSEKEDAKSKIKDAEIIFADQFVCPLNNDILDEAKDLKLLILNTTSYHLVDLEYLKSRKITVCNTPDFCSDSVAELAFLYVMTLMKNTTLAYEDNKDRPFEIFPDDMSHRIYVWSNLNKKTIWVIWLWNIWEKVCSIANGFNMNVVWFNRSEKNINNVTNVGLDELLGTSDIIVITVPYNKETHNLLNENNISSLKDGVCIVNISSQDILDENTVIDCLKSGKIWSYGLDNFTNKDKTHFFYNSKKVMTLPHLWFFTQESLDMIWVRMMESYNWYINWREINTVTK